MMAAAKRSLSLITVNFWQTGIRALFKFYQAKSGLNQDDAWSEIRKEIAICTVNWSPLPEEWEYQLVRAILVEEHNCTVEEANAMNERAPDSTPVLDALNVCISKARRARKPSNK